MQKTTEKTQNVTMESVFGAPTEREAALGLLRQDWNTWQTFCSFPEEYQEKLLDFLQGKCGIQITYDSFFKHVMNPDRHPERLESFLSALLGQKVKLKQVLPAEGNRLAQHGSLVIMDVVVELRDGSIVDVEMQKVGYVFAGERSCCYASDMVMRQYNRIHAKEGKNFSYKHMKPVYLIILMEKSPAAFQKAASHFIHRRVCTYDSGVELTDLEKIVYISLDVFHKVLDNIDTELKAWLTFFSEEKPERIIQLVSRYPEFLSCYKDITEFRRDPRELINMFSEVLRIADENTALYMIDEQKKEIEARDLMITEQQSMIAEKDNALAEKDNALAEKDSALAEQKNLIAELRQKLAELEGI